MTVLEKGVDELSGGQPEEESGLSIGGAEKFVKKAEPRKEAEMCTRKPNISRALFRNNHRAKLSMAEELIRMGFSREAAGRVLNLDLYQEPL